VVRKPWLYVNVQPNYNSSSIFYLLQTILSGLTTDNHVCGCLVVQLSSIMTSLHTQNYICLVCTRRAKLCIDIVEDRTRVPP